MSHDFELEAQRVLQAHGITRPPVNVDQVAETLKVRVIRDHLEDEVSGMLYRRGVRTHIFVNEADASVRQRFTIAHELGHLIMHSGDVFVDQKFRDSRSSLAIDHQEIEANGFAAALLMPKLWVIKEVVRRQSKHSRLSEEELVEQLSRHFEVSPKAMEYRLANLGLLRTI